MLFVVFAFGLPIFRSVTRDAPKPLPVLAQVGDFTLTNQDGKVAHWSDYRGSVLVVNFIFTTCPNICPLMSMQMAKLQSRLIRSYPAIRLVSISVDPSTDTPDVLKAYGEKYRAEPRLWTFLTGPLDEIQKVVVKGFQMSRVVDGADESNLMSITHGENFIIVDQLGQIRAYRQANNEQDLNSIMRDVAFLANHQAFSAKTDWHDRCRQPDGTIIV